MRPSIHNALLFVMIAAAYSLVAAREIVDISRSGRRIQLDGFLIDWNEKDRKPWSGSNTWHWDALNTPEGVAGYFHGAAVRCSTWTFYIDARHGASRPWKISVPYQDTGRKTGELFCTNSVPRDSLFVLTVEWVIPWDSVAVDSNGTYALHLMGHNACGDTLQPLLITGNMYSLKNNGWFSPRFAGIVLFIALLAAIITAVRITIRKKILRRQSPH
ncbi:MAG: hypothetical protein ABSF80_05690 [Chitinispirillaceae bacterium]